MQGEKAEAGKERRATRKRSDVYLKKNRQRFAGRTQTNSRQRSALGRRHTRGSVFGAGIQKCCLLYYPDLKNINCQPDCPLRSVREKLCINCWQTSLACPRIFLQHQHPDRWVCPKSPPAEINPKPTQQTCLFWNTVKQFGKCLKGGNWAEPQRWEQT